MTEHRDSDTYGLKPDPHPDCRCTPVGAIGGGTLLAGPSVWRYDGCPIHGPKGDRPLRFRITRTGLRFLAPSDPDAEPPCEGAFPGTYTRWAEYTFKTFAAFRENRGESFLAVGTDHEVTEDGIRRKVTAECWLVEIETLEGLLALDRPGDRYCEGVIVRAGHDGATPTIEIYDDYRE